jgi:glycosyltransferase involved in cell wall biosynthesis
MLSILIPTYNYNAFPLVQELLNQATEAGIIFEIIVLDDGSTDAVTLAENSKINEFDHCRFEKNATNFGRTKTRNILAGNSKYEWCLFLDADVIPVETNFIKSYIPYLNDTYDVVVGGYQYENTLPEYSKILRYKYGKCREEKSAKIRNQDPYSAVFSGNILIRKSVFTAYNYSLTGNFYGLDIYFSYQLFINKIAIKHIDNEIYHLGLENNTVFFEKSLTSLDSRIKLLANKPQIEKINSLLKYYNFLKRARLNYLFDVFFKVTEPILKKLILSKNPSLVCFDLYRLGYICRFHA